MTSVDVTKDYVTTSNSIIFPFSREDVFGGPGHEPLDNLSQEASGESSPIKDKISPSLTSGSSVPILFRLSPRSGSRQ